MDHKINWATFTRTLGCESQKFSNFPVIYKLKTDMTCMSHFPIPEHSADNNSRILDSIMGEDI